MTRNNRLFDRVQQLALDDKAPTPEPVREVASDPVVQLNVEIRKSVRQRLRARAPAEDTDAAKIVRRLIEQYLDRTYRRWCTVRLM